MGFNIEQTIGFAIHHSSYLFKGAIKDAFQAAGFDITPEEFVALNLIPEQGIEQGELIKLSLKDKTNITRLVKRMEQKNLVVRQGHPTNGRQQMVVLTQQGDTILQDLLPIVQQKVMAATQGISDKDIETARKVLNQLSQNLV